MVMLVMGETRKVFVLTKQQPILVDESDLDCLTTWNWHISHGYARRNAVIDDRKTSVSMHQQLMGFPNCDVDHINGNRLDNRRSNLRLCNDTLNQQNRKINYNKRFKGVNWHKHIGAWQVSIRVNKQLKHIGYYDDEEYAAKIYNQWALMYFGKFARLNDV